MTYEEIRNIILHQRRRDYSFPTSALDELSDTERKEIEALIIKYSLNGDSFLFDHLGAIKYYDLSQVFTRDVLNSIPAPKKHRLITIAYRKTHAAFYLDYLLDLALAADPDAYSVLSILYKNGELDRRYFLRITEIYDQISDTNPNKAIFAEILKRIGVDMGVEYSEKNHNEKEFLTKDIFEKEEKFPLRCVLKKTDGSEIPVIWNFKKKHRAALLCLHGFGGDKDSSVIKALMEEMDLEGAGVVTFDWPAHGESTAPDYDLTVERCLEDLDAVVKFINQLIKESNKRICCFATGFGGYLATLYRNSHENTFLYLILRSPALKMAETFWKSIQPEECDRLRDGELIERGYERKMHIGEDFYDSLVRNDAYNQEPPYPWNIKIIQGDLDDVVDPEDIKAYAERYKDKKLKLKIFEGTDHLYKRPGEKERIVETVKEFLDHFLHPEKYDLLEVERRRKERAVYLDKVRGCLFGGAIGDALGYPIEFMKENVIWEKYGKNGIDAYQLDVKTGKALISDDTQMTLFTATGLLVGDTRGCLRGMQGPPAGYVYKAYFDSVRDTYPAALPRLKNL